MGECACIYAGDAEHIDIVGRWTLCKEPEECSSCGRTIGIGESFDAIVYKCPDYGGQREHRSVNCADCLSMKALFCEGWYIDPWPIVREHIWECCGDISLKELAELTPRAREMVCDAIQERWDYYDEEQDTDNA